MLASSTVRANLSRRLFVGKAMMCDLFSGPFSQSMLGPLRRRHAAPYSTLTSQLVPSVMICAWNFFNVTKRGEESRKAATFVQVNIQSIREGPKQTSSAGSATNYQGQVGRTHTHSLYQRKAMPYDIRPFLVRACTSREGIVQHELPLKWPGISMQS